MSLRNDIGKALIKWTNNELISRLKEELVNYDINASRRLNQSLHPDSISFDGSSIVTSVVGEAYWKYINYGVNGISKDNNAPEWGHPGGGLEEFHREILDWIPARSIYKPDNYDTYEDFARAIMYSILHKGKEARPFVEDAIENVNLDELRSELITILANEIRKNNGNNNN